MKTNDMYINVVRACATHQFSNLQLKHSHMSHCELVIHLFFLALPIHDIMVTTYTLLLPISTFPTWTSSSAINLFQSQCFSHSSIVSSIGTFFVSARRKQWIASRPKPIPRKGRRGRTSSGRVPSGTLERWLMWRACCTRLWCYGLPIGSPREGSHWAPASQEGGPHDRAKAAT